MVVFRREATYTKIDLSSKDVSRLIDEAFLVREKSPAEVPEPDPTIVGLVTDTASPLEDAMVTDQVGLLPPADTQTIVDMDMANDTPEMEKKFEDAAAKAAAVDTATATTASEANEKLGAEEWGSIVL